LKIYTRKGDDGTTGLLYGGRVAKDSPAIEANGAVDEAQAALGMVRAEAERGSELDGLVVALERDLYVLMGELATAPANRAKLVAGQTLVTATMVARLEELIDDLAGRFAPITEFVLPGQDRASATLDVARTVVRRAERLALAAGAGGSARAPGGSAGAAGSDSQVVPYLNRLSDLLWTMARWQEQGQSLPSRSRPGS
jgi:cob(I)alamin adenosyltransferase